MKTKNILKSTLAVVAVTASSFCAWKAYGTYGSVNNSLLMENLEALSQDGDNPEQSVKHYTKSERSITVYEYNEKGQIVRTITYKEPCCLITKYGSLECDYDLCNPDEA